MHAEGKGNWLAKEKLPQWLRGIAVRKTLIFCVNGAHRSGNGAIMLLCASVANFSPENAMVYLARCRQISGMDQRCAHNHGRERGKEKVDLATWFVNGGPWTFYAPFLTASAPRAPPLLIFCCFPSSPPGRFSSLPRLRPLVARPVAAQLPVPAPASPCAGGLDVCQEAGASANVETTATISFSPTQPRSFSKAPVGVATPPPSPPCPDHACPLSMARPQKKPQRRHSSGAFLSAPVLPLFLLLSDIPSQQPIHCQLPRKCTTEEFIVQVEKELARAPDRRAEEMILMDRVRYVNLPTHDRD